MWSHPATIQRDGPGLRGQRAPRHGSCPCHPPATSWTPHVPSTRVAPTGHDAAASVAAGAEENTDDDGDDVPNPFLLRSPPLMGLLACSRVRRSQWLPAPLR